MATIWSIIVNRIDGAGVVWKEWRSKLISVSSGPPDAGSIPMLGPDGKIDPSMVTGGSGTATLKQTEIDFGPLPVAEKSFTIIDPDVTPASKLVGEIAYVAPTGKDLDEMEMDEIDLKFGPGSGQFTLYAVGENGYVADKFRVNYLIG